MRIHGTLVLAALLSLAGCDKGADGAKPAGSAAPAGGSAKSSLTQQQIDEAFKLTDPDHYEAGLAAVTGKLGAPQKSDATSASWSTTTKEGLCYRLLLTKSKGNELGTTDPANCK
jgi:hypothetical protein